MKITISLYITSIILVTIMSCKTSKKSLVADGFSTYFEIAPTTEGVFINSKNVTNNVFYNWYKVDKDAGRVNWFLLRDNFEITETDSDIKRDNSAIDYDFGYRRGKFKEGKQHGLWECERRYFLDSLGYNVYKKYRFREEYFKNGLRDSIYKIYDKKGNVIYSTYFKNGNGIEKDFHENGKLYYEIETKDGYFTDTLKLYNKRGRLAGLRFYKKDSLVFESNFNTNVIDTIENGKKVRIKYKYSMMHKYFAYQKEYEGKVKKFNENGELIYQKTDTLINRIKKVYTQILNGDYKVKKTEESLYTYATNNDKKTLDYFKLYENGKLIIHKYYIEASKNISAKTYTIGYNENGEIIYKSVKDSKNYKGKYPYLANKTIYYEKGKEIYRTQEVIDKITIEDNRTKAIKKIQKIYYDLKGN